MKKLLLGISFLLSASFAQAQWTNNGTWDYSFGTATPATTLSSSTASVTSSSTSTTANFLPSPPSGTVGVHLNANATNGSFTLNSDNTLKLQLPSAGTITRFSAIDVAVATDVVVNKFKIKFSAAVTGTDGGNYVYAIGNNKGNLFNPTSNNSVYRSSDELFTALRMTLVTTANSTAVKLEYRLGSDASATTSWTTIDQTTFQKGSEYAVEVYCNNTATDQVYTIGTTSYTLPTNTFNLWVAGVQIGANYPRSIEVSGGAGLGGTSIALANGVALNSILFLTSGAAAATGNIIITNPVLIYKVAVTPVSLTSFTGKKANNGVELKWQTASELNNNYFEVLRSENGKDFTSIGTIKGNGTSQEIRNYNFTDVNPVSGANYYQLKQTDFDGTAKIVGETVAVTFGNNLPEFNVSSNGNTLKVFVFANNAGLNNLVITDMQGKKVAQDSRILAKGYNTFSINVGSLNAGVFVAQSSNADGTKVAKFIKD
jgi:hypothetical protein